MDKTHNISLGGFAFSIDDVAYRILSKYLKDIKISLGNSTGIDEIISDIEYRMAELLRERMMAREVVNQTDIDYLISTMGQPEEFYNEEFFDDEDSSKKSYSSHYSKGPSKKLFRDPDDKMLGGVCSGLGHYFGVDATWVRIIAVVLLFVDPIFFSVGGTIFISYFILWLVVPEAKTTSDKLQMRGEPVNVDSIKDFFGNSSETVRNNLNDFGNDARRVANNSGSIIGNIVRIIVKIIGFFFLGILLIIAISLLIAFFGAVLGVGGALFGIGGASIAMSDYLPYFFENGWEKWVAYICLGLVLILPAIGLILAVLRMISKRYSVPRAVGFGLPLAWLAGVIGLISIFGVTIRHFSKPISETKTLNIPIDSTRLYIEMDEDEGFSIGGNGENEDLLSIKPGFLAFPKDNDIKVKKSENGETFMTFEYMAKGETKAKAKENLDVIKYNYQLNDSLLRLDNYLFIKEGSKWRNQRVKPTLYLAEGREVSFKNIDVETSNGVKYWNGDNSEKIYKFEGNKFSCANCIKDEDDNELVIDTENSSVTNKNGVITIKSGNDSITIKTDQNGTGSINISNGDD